MSSNVTNASANRNAVTNTGAAPRPGGAFLGLTRVFNRLTMLLAGTRWLPLYGVIEHRGRRSGKLFHTPVVVRPLRDGFIVPMPWGEGTDWYRNVRAAGGCTVRWRGREFSCTAPTFVDKSVALAASRGLVRRMVERMDMPGGFIQLTRTPAPEHSAMQSGW